MLEVWAGRLQAADLVVHHGCELVDTIRIAAEGDCQARGLARDAIGGGADRNAVAALVLMDQLAQPDPEHVGHRLQLVAVLPRPLEVVGEGDRHPALGLDAPRHHRLDHALGCAHADVAPGLPAAGRRA
jgi:hypothetical protein